MADATSPVARDLWREGLDVIDDLLDLPTEVRDAEATSRCSGNAALLEIVRDMLAADSRSRVALDPTTRLRAVEAIAKDVWRGVADEVEDPRQVGPYTILRRLGAGGMGVVYEAEQDNPRRLVAVKVLHPWLASEPVGEAFAFEAQALADLRFPGIPEVFGAGADGALRYVAMERVVGTPLTTWATDHHLSRRSRLELFLRICDAVHQAHGHGVVHRDLKPANLLVTASGDVRILDFGIAMFQGAQSLAAGTPGYMAPEQTRRGALVDARADIHALGVILHELLTERRPLTARSARDRDPETGEVVARAIADDPGDRFATVEDMARVLRHLLSQTTVEVPPSRWQQWSAGVLGLSLIPTAILLAIDPAIAATSAALGLSAAAVAAAALEVRVERRLRAALEETRARAAQAEAGTLFLSHVLSAKGPEVDEDGSRLARSVVERLSDGELAASPSVQARVRSSIAQTLYDLGHPAEALRQHQQVVAAYRSGAPVDPDVVFDSFSHVASDAVAQVRAEADEMLDELEGVLDARTRWVAGYLRGRLRCLQGDRGHGLDLQWAACQAAEAYLREVQDPREFLSKRRTLSIFWRHTGMELARAGRFDEGRVALDRCMDLERRAGDARPPRAALILDAMAGLERLANEFDKAHEYGAAALEVATDRLGPDHSITGMIYRNLAHLEVDAGRPAAAIPLLERTIAIQTAGHGPAYAPLARDYAVLSVALARRGDVTADQAAVFADWVEAAEAAGADARTVASARMLHVWALLDAGLPAQAKVVAASIPRDALDPSRGVVRGPVRDLFEELDALP